MLQVTISFYFVIFTNQFLLILFIYWEFSPWVEIEGIICIMAAEAFDAVARDIIWGGGCVGSYEIFFVNYNITKTNLFILNGFF